MKVCDSISCKEEAKRYISFGFFHENFDLCEKHLELILEAVKEVLK